MIFAPRLARLAAAALGRSSHGGRAVAEQTAREVAEDLLASVGEHRFATVLADPPWQFDNRTGKMAPEHRRLGRYATLRLEEIAALPVADIVEDPAHLYLWVPNAMLAEGLAVMAQWGFAYKTNIIWYKVRKDGGPDRRGVGFYFRNVTEMILFGVRGKGARTLAPGRRQENIISSRKREHSRKPDEQYPLIESCSPGPRIELFARQRREGWHCWGDEADRFAGSDDAAQASPPAPGWQPALL